MRKCVVCVCVRWQVLSVILMPGCNRAPGFGASQTLSIIDTLVTVSTHTDTHCGSPAVNTYAAPLGVCQLGYDLECVGYGGGRRLRQWG